MGRGHASSETSFACHRCGACCTRLREAWDKDPDPPRALAHDPRIHRLPRPGGLRVFAWEATPFPRGKLSPLLVAADEPRDGLIGLAYELDEAICPNYDPGQGCTIYEERPLVCQAYPLIVVPGEDGPELTVSSRCPGRVPVEPQTRSRPEEVLADAYPEEIGPARTVPAAVLVLTHALDLLEAAGTLDPVCDLGEDEITQRAERGTQDLLDVAADDQILDASTLRGRIQRIKARLSEPRSRAEVFREG